MIKKIWQRIINSFWRKQNKKISQMEKQIAEMNQQIAEMNQQLTQQKKKTVRLQKKMKEEFERRDEWAIRSAELRHLAKGKKIWVIKSPVPDSESKVKWAEYQFFLDLKKELEAQGYFVYIDYYENWNGPIDADFVLVSRCHRKYHPDRRVKDCKYILWVNCHPDKVEKEEYELYDCVLVSSYTYAKKLAAEVSVPVKPFLLCTDTTRFYPKETEIKYDKIFVGNTRGVTRDCIFWCEDHQIEVNLWGRKDGKVSWGSMLKADSSIKLEGFMPNENLPELYRASRVVLNNHYDDMRREGFINLRAIEALCCGCVLLSDYHSELEMVFGDSIVYYHDEEDFLQKLEWIEEHYEEQREKALSMWPKLKAEFSFEVRARELAKEAEML